MLQNFQIDEFLAVYVLFCLQTEANVATNDILQVPTNVTHAQY